MSVTGSATSPDLNWLKGKISSLSPYALDKTLSAEGSGADAKAVGEALEKKVSYTAIVDDLNTPKTELPLSANQGVALKKLVTELKVQTEEAINEAMEAANTAQITANGAKAAAEEAQSTSNSAQEGFDSQFGSFDERFGELETAISKKAETASYYGTLSAATWSASAPHTQVITVPGLLATDEPFVDVYLEGVDDGTAIIESWMAVGRVTVSADNTVTAYCYEEAPNIDIPIILKVVR